MTVSDTQQFITHTRRWIDKVVIGLNLCPFARAPQHQGLIRYVVSNALDHEALTRDLQSELQYLAEVPLSEVETTILIHPHVLQNFMDYNFFLQETDYVLKNMQLEGVIQIASMHPEYQFAGTDSEDAENFTNRSPYPLLHLIREESLDSALSSYKNPERIPERNIRIMEKYGTNKMQLILNGCMRDIEE